MNIIIFSDLHGRILLAFKLVKRLEQERGIKIDLILQCGDVGIFPDINQLDKATLRHAKRDRSELGFYDYFVQENVVTTEVLKDLTCHCVCVRGNHEDHDFLNALEIETQEARYFVDHYQKIAVCKTGHLQQFTFNDASLNVMGIGRIGDRKGRTDDRFIQSYERKALSKSYKHKVPTDILLTHDSAKDFITNDFGMQEIRDYLTIKKPTLHFFGHTGTPHQQVLDDNGRTLSVKVAELEFKDSDILPYGSMLLLDWNTASDYRLEVVDDAWFREYGSSTWNHIS